MINNMINKLFNYRPHFLLPVFFAVLILLAIYLSIFHFDPLHSQRLYYDLGREQFTRGADFNNFYTLYDMAMLGFVSHSKLPLRLASFIGFGASIISFFLGLAYLIYKLLFWYSFELGLAPLIIGLFFFASIQLFFIGVIGEYIGAIYTQVRKHPLVIERERINFD